MWRHRLTVGGAPGRGKSRDTSAISATTAMMPVCVNQSRVRDIAVGDSLLTAGAPPRSVAACRHPQRLFQARFLAFSATHTLATKNPGTA